MTRKERRENWQRLINEQCESGLSGAAFCRQHGIAPSTFTYWKRRLHTNTPIEGFVEILSDSASRTSSGIRIRLDERVSIEVDQGFDLHTFCAVFDALCTRGMS